MLFAYLVVGVVCLSAVRAGQAGFSVSYFAHAEHPQVVNADFVSSSQPSAVQIADIYNRLSGFSPLLVEGVQNDKPRAAERVERVDQ